MTKCVLFHTEGCHLCEEALAMLIQQLPEAEIELIDITEDAAHVEKYQFSIPVVKRSRDDAELGWPFSTQQLQEFLN
ncbi:MULTISPECIES: glutaredoxin family protein [unclassified Pseudoalteromonas]|uniref:glutaredoxin family protein n=1 Tax=unclassified Pseudoalteromonas TaxID=194690 RepID=UPI0030155E86